MNNQSGRWLHNLVLSLIVVFSFACSPYATREEGGESNRPVDRTEPGEPSPRIAQEEQARTEGDYSPDIARDTDRRRNQNLVTGVADAQSTGGVAGADDEIIHNTEAYDHVPENQFFEVAQQPLSTFSADVDTASYSIVRRFLNNGSLPPAGAVRIEEMINYFNYSYSPPADGKPFAVHTELAECPWNPEHKFLHVGIQGRVIDAEQMPPRNLVFLLDVSGSMNSSNKLPLLKRGMRMLVEQLNANDRVAIVVYAGASGLVLPPTAGNDQQRILEAMDKLQAGGSTNGGAGIELAYRTARENFHPQGINRVILATDGDFNVGTTNQSDLVEMIERERESGVFLTVLGFGSGNLKDSTMEKLADQGNGNYAYIDNVSEARKVLVTEAGSTLVAIAKDVKLQIEFNPNRVSGYRLIGYENRVMRNEDFNDDTKDAGEIGAGHSVTALYEIVPVGAKVNSGDVDALRYQQERETTDAAAGNEVALVKIRYKHPDGDTSQLLSYPVLDSQTDITQASDNFRFSAAVAAYGMLLRDSEHSGTATFEMVKDLARGALENDPGGYRAEFLRLTSMAADLKSE
ncbi:MAG: VWA domain-containing protein [Leptospiraceae bacterium]|nr:VWA domain-containing protein [Leptospiraceae bacterium]